MGGILISRADRRNRPMNLALSSFALVAMAAEFACEYTLDEYAASGLCSAASASRDESLMQPPSFRMTHSSTSSCSSGSHSQEHSSSQSQSDRSVEKTSRLLAALSFERLLPNGSFLSPDKKEQKKERRAAKSRIRASKKKLTDNEPPRSMSITTVSPRARAQHILHGTLDPEGHVEDIFYDAQQQGDAGADEFSANYTRESVVMSCYRSTGREYVEVLVDREQVPMIETQTSWQSIRGGAFETPKSPQAPQELPLRFLRAGKGDPEEGLRRYEETLKWRAENEIDTILRQPMPDFALIKKHYPHFCHGMGRNGEPCFYEQPPKTNLKALRAGGVTLDRLMRHYSMVSEYQWQYVCRDDLQRSIYIIDLEGIRMGDFVGEVVDFVKKASALSATHYPERAGYVFVINVPSWFRFIWSVIKPWVDEVTLEKIYILRGEEEIRQNLLERIDIHNLPEDYGGTAGKLGESQEEQELWELARHNNAIARGERPCTGPQGGCQFCAWVPPRAY